MTLGACCVYIYSQVDDCIRLRVCKCTTCVCLFVFVVVLGTKPPKGISKDTYSNIAPFPVVSVLQRYAPPPFLWEIGVSLSSSNNKDLTEGKAADYIRVTIVK